MFALQGGTIEIIGIAAGVAWALGGALKPASLLASILGFIIAGFVVFRIPNWPSVDLYNTALNWTFLVQHILGMAVIAVAIQWIAVGILALRKW